MRMKNPVHPGELVKANLEALNLTTAAAARALKITRQQMHNVVSCKSAISPEMALRFEQAFGGSADMWLRMQSAYDLAAIRRHEKPLKIKRIFEPEEERAGV